MADRQEGAGHTREPGAPRPWWWHLWGLFLTLLIIDLGMLLVAPLLWGGGKWSVLLLKITLVMMIGVDVLLSIAFGVGMSQRKRARTRPPRI